MLTPEYLLHISEGAEEIAGQLHREIIDRIIERIMVRIGRGDDYLLTVTDKWNIEVLQDAGYLLKDIQKEIAKATKLQEKEIKEAFEEAGVKAIEYEDSIYRSAGLSPLPLRESPHLTRLMQRNYEATLGEWRNFTRTTVAASQQTFIKAMDKAYTLTTSGAISYTQAVREAIKEVASEGVTVTYSSGKTDTLETAALRAVRTGVSQATAQIQIARMKEMRNNLVITSSHLGARPTHEVWQGQIFYLDWSKMNKIYPLKDIPTPDTADEKLKVKYPDFVESTGLGKVDGLCGANCRHSFSCFYEGQNNPFKHYDTEKNRKAYALSQQQRSLERRIRKTKREVMGLKAAVDNATDPKVKFELDLDYQKKAALLEKQNKAYNEFCDKNGLKRLSDRLETAKWDRQQAAEARGAAKRYENSRTTASTAIDKNRNANYNNKRTVKELQSVTHKIKSEIPSYANNESRWSGKINIDNSMPEGVLGRKEWSCDITLKESVDDGTIWHEMLHSCSESHYDPQVYERNKWIEEASVEFLKQQICIEKKIASIQAYEEKTTILKALNNKFAYGTDMEFAKELFNVPLPERYQWLEDRVDSSLRELNAPFQDYNEIIRFTKLLEGGE